MRDLFDRLIAEGEAGIDRLIEEAAQETLQLDFKRKEVDRNGEFSPNDRKILAEALSGFANSAGGLIVFGVYARKGQDQIDCVQSAHPISDIRRFYSEAKTEVGRLVQPRLDDVAIEIIPSERADGAGYLLIYVPRSERRPHRSEAKNQKGYYKRVGDSFFEMEHYDIEDAFARTSTPKLDLMFSLGDEDDHYNRLDKTVFVHLSNSSDAMARFPFLNLWDFDPALLKSSGVIDGKHGLRLFRIQRTLQFLGGADDVVHSHSQILIAAFTIRVSLRDNVWMYGRKPAADASFEFKYRIGCENMRSVTDKVSYRLSKFMPAYICNVPPEPSAIA